MLKFLKVSIPKKRPDLNHEASQSPYLKVCEASLGIQAWFCTLHYAKWLTTEAGMSQHSQGLRELVAHAEQIEISPQECQDLRSKIYFGLESYLHDPPPQELIDEWLLYLRTKPELVVEYLGRGKDPDAQVLDVPGGHRSYLWRVTQNSQKERLSHYEERFQEIKEWAQDPGAEFVLCLGGGGLRMIALASFFKVMDYLHLREHISAVWGCSMGAIVGYVYATGLEPHKIEKIAYGVYNARFGQTSLHAKPGDLIWNLLRRRFKGEVEEATGLSEIKASLLQILDEMSAQMLNSSRSIPMVAVATNVTQRRVMGLALNHEVDPSLAHMLRVAEPLVGLAASAAVPVLFEAQRIQGPQGIPELWVDGALGEEVPISLAFQAWRTRKAQGLAKPKLKILYVDSGSEFSQLDFFNRIEKYLKPLSNSVMPWRMMDVLYESRFRNLEQLLKGDPAVEIYGIKLDLNGASAVDPMRIPHVIRHGRHAITVGMNKINANLLETLKKKVA